MVDKIIFGMRIRELRQSKNLTQEEFGKPLGLSKQAVSGLETGYRTTTIDTLAAIADFFDVSSDYLLGRSDNPKQR